MVHQLDFKVTLWSDDKELLLLVEKMLQQLEQHTDSVGGDNPAKNLHSFATLMRSKAYNSGVSRVDVHSIDINWDDEVVE